MNNFDFKDFIKNSLQDLTDLTGTTDVSEMCEQTYVTPSPANYSNPEVFRTALYALYDFESPPTTFLQ